MTRRHWSIYCCTDGAVCKVGLTFNATSRLAALKAHSGIEALRLERAWPLPASLSRLDVDRVERALHAALRRMLPPPRFGEWYMAAPADVTEAVDAQLPSAISRVIAARHLCRVPVERAS